MANDSSAPVDLSHLAPIAAREQIGELVGLCLQRSGACVLLRRTTGEITVVDPQLLVHVPDEEMATALLPSWGEDEVYAYLAARQPDQEEPHG